MGTCSASCLQTLIKLRLQKLFGAQDTFAEWVNELQLVGRNEWIPDGGSNLTLHKRHGEQTE